MQMPLFAHGLSMQGSGRSQCLPQKPGVLHLQLKTVNENGCIKGSNKVINVAENIHTYLYEPRVFIQIPRSPQSIRSTMHSSTSFSQLIPSKPVPSQRHL